MKDDIFKEGDLLYLTKNEWEILAELYTDKGSKELCYKVVASTPANLAAFGCAFDESYWTSICIVEVISKDGEYDTKLINPYRGFNGLNGECSEEFMAIMNSYLYSQYTKPQPDVAKAYPHQFLDRDLLYVCTDDNEAIITLKQYELGFYSHVLMASPSTTYVSASHFDKGYYDVIAVVELEVEPGTDRVTNVSLKHTDDGSEYFCSKEFRRMISDHYGIEEVDVKNVQDKDTESDKQYEPIFVGATVIDVPVPMGVPVWYAKSANNMLKVRIINYIVSLSNLHAVVEVMPDGDGKGKATWRVDDLSLLNEDISQLL